MAGLYNRQKRSLVMEERVAAAAVDRRHSSWRVEHHTAIRRILRMP